MSNTSVEICFTGHCRKSGAFLNSGWRHRGLGPRQSSMIAARSQFSQGMRSYRNLDQKPGGSSLHPSQNRSCNRRARTSFGLRTRYRISTGHSPAFILLSPVLQLPILCEGSRRMRGISRWGRETSALSEFSIS